MTNAPVQRSALPRLRASDGRRPWAKPTASTNAPVRCARGFTLLEVALAVALVGLLAALVVPRLSVLRGANLDASARQLAGRIRLLREEAALRGEWIRLAVDPASSRYAATVLVETSTGARFLPRESPLYRPTRLPEPISIDLVGAGVSRTVEGFPATVFSPDGYADPAAIYLDDGAGNAFTIVIEPTFGPPRVFDRRVDARELDAQ